MKFISFLVLFLPILSAMADVSWSGKRVSIVGDSYSAYGNCHGSRNSHFPYGSATVRSEDQMWWSQVIREFGGVLETNRTSGGSEFTYQYGVCPSFINYVKDGQLGKPDVILVMGGLNDFWVHQVPEATFRNAVKGLFDCLDSEHAQAEKFVILPKIHNVADYRWGLDPMYRNVIRDLSNERGYTLIDLEGAYGEDEGDLDSATYPHPTLQGMNKIARRVVSRIKYGAGDYLRRYDCLETDARSYMVTDYVPNLFTTEVEMKVGFVDGVHVETNVLYFAGSPTGAKRGSGRQMSLVARKDILYYQNSTDGGATSVGPKIGVAVEDMPSATVFACRNGSSGVSNGVQIATARNALRVDETELVRPAMADDVAADGSLVLFGMRDATNSAYYGMAVKRIFNVRIYESAGGTERRIVRDWVPVLNREGVPTLYDRVTDACLAVYGGGRMTALDLAGPYVNRETGVEYSDLQTAYSLAKIDETVSVRVPPLEPMTLVARMGVPLDSGGYDGIEVVSPNARYRVVKKGNLYTLEDLNADAPKFVCETACDLFKPVDGMLRIRVTNVRKGFQYNLLTTTSLDGEWTPVGEWQAGMGVDLEFVFPAPEKGTRAFFMKALKRDEE